MISSRKVALMKWCVGATRREVVSDPSADREKPESDEVEEDESSSLPSRTVWKKWAEKRLPGRTTDRGVIQCEW